MSLVVRNSKEELVLPCPVCRQDTPIPAGGVASLQPAFHMNRLFEIRNALQQQCDEPVLESEDGPPGDKELAEAIVSWEKAEAARIYCSEHPEKGVELYCESCSELICVYCITKGGKHLNHNHELLGEAFENYKQSIAPLLESLDNHFVTTDTALEQLDARCKEISVQQENNVVDIRNAIKRLHQTLEAREAELISHLDGITRGKLKNLAIQKDRLETTIAQLARCLDAVRDSLESSNHGEVLRTKKSIVERAETLCANCKSQAHNLKLDAEADMVFLASADASRDTGKSSRLFHPTPPGVTSPGKPQKQPRSKRVRKSACRH